MQSADVCGRNLTGAGRSRRRSRGGRDGGAPALDVAAATAPLAAIEAIGRAAHGLHRMVVADAEVGGERLATEAVAASVGIAAVNGSWRGARRPTSTAPPEHHTAARCCRVGECATCRTPLRLLLVLTAAL